MEVGLLSGAVWICAWLIEPRKPSTLCSSALEACQESCNPGHFAQEDPTTKNNLSCGMFLGDVSCVATTLTSCKGLSIVLAAGAAKSCTYHMTHYERSGKGCS